MRRKFKKIIVPTIMLLIMVGLLGSTYYYLYMPLKNECNQLENDIATSTLILQQLRSIEFNQNQYEAELLEYKSILDRYQIYANEYGSYPRLMMMLDDMERRIGVEILDITPSDSGLDMTINTSIKSLKDFLIELESIEFFYDCNSIQIKSEDGNGFSFVQDPLDNINEIETITVILSSEFNTVPESDMSDSGNEIEQLLKDLGLEDSVVTP